MYSQIVVLRHEQIANTLHVDFHVADSDGVLDVTRGCEDARKDLFDDTRDHTLASIVVDVASHHSIRLARSSLPVGEDGAVVSIENIVDGRADRVIEYINLARAHIEDSIEGEGPGGLLGLHACQLGVASSVCTLVPWTWTYVDRTCVLGLEVNDRLTTAGNLNLVLWTETRHHCIVVGSVLVASARTHRPHRIVPLMELLLQCQISVMLVAHRNLERNVRHDCETLQYLGPAASLEVHLSVWGGDIRCGPSGSGAVIPSHVAGVLRVVGEGNEGPAAVRGKTNQSAPSNANATVQGIWGDGQRYLVHPGGEERRGRWLLGLDFGLGLELGLSSSRGERACLASLLLRRPGSGLRCTAGRGRLMDDLR